MEEVKVAEGSRKRKIAQSDDQIKLGSKAVELPPIWPQHVLDEIAKNEGFVFQYDKKDPLLNPEDKYARYKVRPIRHGAIYKLYKEAEAAIWTAGIGLILPLFDHHRGSVRFRAGQGTLEDSDQRTAEIHQKSVGVFPICW